MNDRMPVAAQEEREPEVGSVPRNSTAAVPMTVPSLRDLVQITRPQQWTKNLVVFAALIFSKHLFELDAVLLVVAAFACFCLVASGCYVINDLRDLERDRQHPLKSRRPLPAGRMARQTARLLAAMLLATGLAGSFILQQDFFLLITLYAALQLAYSFVLKDMVILDVMVIASGFVIRAIAGGVIIEVPVSQWLIICTFLGALFLGFCKRRHELVLLEGRATDHREALREYSPYFLDQMISVVTASTVVAYAIYTASPEVSEKLGTDHLYLTIPFVLFGIFRYLYLVHQREEGGNPTQVLLTDRPLLADMLLWITTATLLLYWG